MKLGSDEGVPESYKLIAIRSRGAFFEIEKAFRLGFQVRKVVLDVVNNKSINPETIFEVTAAVENVAPLPLVGSERHAPLLTHRIVAFYLTTRMFFPAKQVNRNNCI